jgi:hypothetical protein
VVERHTKPWVPYEVAHGATEVPQTQQPDQSRPTADWTKTQLKGWLNVRGIAYAPDASKAELQTLAGIN